MLGTPRESKEDSTFSYEVIIVQDPKSSSLEILFESVITLSYTGHLSKTQVTYRYLFSFVVVR
uniref:Uncharacterized protein n=1 Tax=Magallana gigas TaxID=29159 RepID=K1Q321_MAGGI